MNLSFEEFCMRQGLLVDCFDAITPNCPEPNLREDWIDAVFLETLPIAFEVFAHGIERAKSQCSFHGQVLPLLWRAANEA